MNLKSTVAVAATTLALSSSAVYGSVQSAQAGEVIRDHPVVHGAIATATGRACKFDDGTPVNCYWNAHTMGNGIGHSFYSVKVQSMRCIVYWNRKYNRHHGVCFAESGS